MARNGKNNPQTNPGPEKPCHCRDDEPRFRMMPSRYPGSSPSSTAETPEMRLYNATRTPDLSQIKEVLECRLMMDLMEPYNPNLTDEELIKRAARDGRTDLIMGNIPELSPWSPLHEAVRSGGIDTVRRLLADRTDVQAATVTGRTALHWAADLGDRQIVQVLLEAGARANATDIFGLTPLEYASSNGHDEIFDLLLNYF